MRLIFLSILILSNTALFSQEKTINELYSEIEKIEHNLPKKINLYNKILHLNPNEYIALVEQGQAYYDRWRILGKIDIIYLDSAITQLKRAIELDESRYEAFYQLGEIFNDLGDFDNSLKLLSKAIELKSDLYGAKLSRAFIYLYNSEYYLALEDINSLIKYLGRNKHYLKMRSVCYANLGDLKLCKKDINSALSFDKTDNETYLLLADYNYLRGDIKKAIKIYNFIIERNNEFALAFLKRGNAFAIIEDEEKAKIDWDIAKSKGIEINDLTMKFKFGYLY